VVDIHLYAFQFFNDTNVVETWKLVFNILAKGGTDEILTSTVDLLDIMILNERLKDALSR
jgi:hypothetical protein